MTLGWRERRSKAAGKANEQRVLDALIDLREESGPNGDDVSIQDVARRTGINANTVGGILSRLKLAGAVEHVGCNRYGEWIPLRLDAHEVKPVVREVNFE